MTKMKNIKVTELFDLQKTIAKDLFSGIEYPWEILDKISLFILSLGKTLQADLFTEIKPGVWVANDAKIAASAYIDAPCIIDSGAEIRHCAYIRGSAVIGKNAVVGNSCEIKNAVLFDKVQVPHFNYIGDSVLGYASHMGAGAVTSNVKSDKTNVFIKNGNDTVETGRKKVGAFLGDYAEIGCNSVLCPGTVIGSNTTVYPTSCVRGTIPADSIYKSNNNIVTKK